SAVAGRNSGSSALSGDIWRVPPTNLSHTRQVTASRSRMSFDGKIFTRAARDRRASRIPAAGPARPSRAQCGRIPAPSADRLLVLPAPRGLGSRGGSGRSELLSQLSHDFRNRIQELGDNGGEALLGSLEDQPSNVLPAYRTHFAPGERVAGGN